MATYHDFEMEPPCATCRPELHPDNAEAHAIYLRTCNQLITSMGGVLDINVLAVTTIMDLEGIADRRECMAKVQRIARTVISEQRRDHEAKREADRQ